MEAPFWPYKLYTLLALGRIAGAERRGSRVFMHLPTTAKWLGIPSSRLRLYIEHGSQLAIFDNINKRPGRIWAFDIILPREESRQ